MDQSKKAAFVKAMGKKEKRLKLSKGGMIRKIAGRHYFDDGGTVLSGPSGVGSNSSATVNNHGLTGTVGNLLGLNNQFQAQGANIQQGTNAAQLNQAYSGAQSAIQQQQALADQLAAQGAQGMGTQSALTGQLQGVINGTGPNAAQMALNQNTAANVQQQAALMAGQRGASANAGLLARQAAMQGAATQQNAVGQAATLQAQQQIAAQQQLQGLAQTQVGQQAGAVEGLNNAQQNEQNILQGANTAANNAAVTMQSNINNVNAGIAAENQQQAGKTFHGIAGAAGALPVVGSVFGGFAHGGEIPHMDQGGTLTVNMPQPTAMPNVPWLSSTPYSSPGPSAGNTPNPLDMRQASDPKKEKNPDTEKKADEPTGARNSDGSPNLGVQGVDPPTSSGGANLGVSGVDTPAASNFGLGANTSSLAVSPDVAALGAAHGGAIHPKYFDPKFYDDHFSNYYGGGKTEKVPAMVSPGEIYLSPEAVHRVVHEGADPMKIGEKIKGKAKVKGDSLKNDTVPKDLQEGGVVIPRHIATHKMSADKAALFVHRAVAKKRAGG